MDPKISPRQPRLPIGFAHRGASAEVRGNTIEAFRRALDAGASGLESDAWVTADGVVVLDHDGVIRSGLRRRPIATALRRELPSHVPTLAELYEACGTGFELSLDIKDPAAAPVVVAVARSGGAGVLERLWLCSADWTELARWRPFCGGAGLVVSTRLDALRDGAAAHATTFHTADLDAVNLREREWTAPLVATFHHHHLLTFGWDAQSDAQLEHLLALGIDGLYCDHPARMLRALRSHRDRAGGG